MVHIINLSKAFSKIFLFLIFRQLTPDCGISKRSDPIRVFIFPIKKPHDTLYNEPGHNGAPRALHFQGGAHRPAPRSSSQLLWHAVGLLPKEGEHVWLGRQICLFPTPSKLFSANTHRTQTRIYLGELSAFQFTSNVYIVLWNPGN